MQQGDAAASSGDAATSTGVSPFAQAAAAAAPGASPSARPPAAGSCAAGGGGGAAPADGPVGHPGSSQPPPAARAPSSRAQSSWTPSGGDRRRAMARQGSPRTFSHKLAYIPPAPQARSRSRGGSASQLASQADVGSNDRSSRGGAGGGYGLSGVQPGDVEQGGSPRGYREGEPPLPRRPAGRRAAWGLQPAALPPRLVGASQSTQNTHCFKDAALACLRSPAIPAPFMGGCTSTPPDPARHGRRLGHDGSRGPQGQLQGEGGVRGRGRGCSWRRPCDRAAGSALCFSGSRIWVSLRHKWAVQPDAASGACTRLLWRRCIVAASHSLLLPAASLPAAACRPALASARCRCRATLRGWAGCPPWPAWCCWRPQ